MKRTGLLLLALSLILAACGTVAEPVFQADIEETQVAQAETSEAATASAPTATATATVTPTAPATEPPTETPTEAPTEATTEAPTEAPTDVPPTDPPQEAGGSDEVTGDPAAGEVLFNTFVAQANFACNTCHMPNSEARLIGPGLQHVGERAASRVESLSAVEYIHQSIVEPSAFVVPEYPDMLMPHVYGDVFTEEQISDLIAYLMSL